MSTWISRTIGLLLAALPLAACDEASGLPFAAELAGPGKESETARMATVSLAGGDVILAAPQGYCIDRRAVRRGVHSGFAVMARCDTLGVRGFFSDHDLAIITVTTAPHAPGELAPTVDDVERSTEGAQVLDRKALDGLSLVRVAAPADPLDGVSRVHWRGVFELNGHLVGVGLYAPEGSAVLDGAGAKLLNELTLRTRKASLTRVRDHAATDG